MNIKIDKSFNWAPNKITYIKNEKVPSYRIYGYYNDVEDNYK